MESSSQYFSKLSLSIFNVSAKWKIGRVKLNKPQQELYILLKKNTTFMWRTAEKQNKWLDVENYENDHENGMGLYTHRWLSAILQ